jgi:hypothetical protein
MLKHDTLITTRRSESNFDTSFKPKDKTNLSHNCYHSEQAVTECENMIRYKRNSTETSSVTSFRQAKEAVME